MLTPRQQEVLYIIVELYGRFEEPVGSKTLLKESLLKVSPATIRNDMAALEDKGFLTKAHTSSGRIPSTDGYRYYIDYIIEQEENSMIDLEIESFEALIQARNYSPLELARLSSDLLASLTGYTAMVLGQDQVPHRLEEFKLVPLNKTRYITLLMTDYGKIESDMFELNMPLSSEDITKAAAVVNEELKGVVLEDVYQRMKLSIPLQIQKVIGYQLDFSPVVEKAMHNIKGHRYFVSGKSNIFDLIDSNSSKETIKELFDLVDGSRAMYQLLEARTEKVEVIFGHEFLSDQLSQINLITGSYRNQNQRIIIGLLGPTTMAYERIIPMIDIMINKLSNL